MSKNPIDSINNQNSKLLQQGAFYRNDNTKLSINAYKKNLQNILNNLNQLRVHLKELKAIENNVNDEMWNSKLKAGKHLQTIIKNSIENCKTAPTLNELNNLLKARLKKRNYLKLRSAKLKNAKKELLENRKRLEVETFEWIKKKQMKNLENKNIQEAARKSEIVLYDVNKKIAEAQRHIDLFEMLEKLRKYRKNTYGGKDYKENSFIMKMARLKNVWKDALFEYNTEKIKLQSFLSKNTKQPEQQWKEMFFGCNYESDSMNREPKSLQEFIEIRRTWDSYIVPVDSSYGSSIPQGWVLPTGNPLKEWNLYRTNE